MIFFSKSDPQYSYIAGELGGMMFDQLVGYSKGNKNIYGYLGSKPPLARAMGPSKSLWDLYSFPMQPKILDFWGIKWVLYLLGPLELGPQLVLVDSPINMHQNKILRPGVPPPGT